MFMMFLPFDSLGEHYLDHSVRYGTVRCDAIFVVEYFRFVRKYNNIFRNLT